MVGAEILGRKKLLKNGGRGQEFRKKEKKWWREQEFREKET